VEALKREGFAALGMSNGRDALAYLSDGGPASVIVLDLMMPDMDGWAFRRAQRRDPWLADIPVIVVSVLEGRPLRGLSAVACLEKPVNLLELVAVVQTLCERQAQLERQTH
jgi:DNA-binding response OmpR family regulator